MVHSAVLKKKNFLDENDELVFKLLISYNEDRQISSLIDLNINSTEEYPVEDKYIIIESIGEYFFYHKKIRILGPLMTESKK